MKTQQHQSGFTLLELIMVIILMGILAVSARAAFTGPDRFTGKIVQDQVISSLRLAQQAALAKNDGNQVTATLSTSGNDLVLTVAHASYSSVRTIDASGASLTWSTTSLSGSCGPVTGSLPHTMVFDSRGETTRTRLCVSGSNPTSICLSALGFAYAGDCD